jgi:hypothetical protein
MARSFNDFQYAILILHDPPSEQRLLFSPASAKEGVRGFFNTALDDLDDPHAARACLMARGVSSEVLAEGDLKKVVHANMTAFVGAFAGRLKSAKATGELPLDFEAELVAEQPSASAFQAHPSVPPVAG